VSILLLWEPCGWSFGVVEGRVVVVVAVVVPEEREEIKSRRTDW